MPHEAVSEMTYNLVYRHSLDDKRRLPVPYRWRPKPQEPIEFTLIVWPKNPAGACLRVLPPAAWAKFRAEIDAMQDIATKPILKRMIGSYSTSLRLDSAGRLTIPEEMAVEADITTQAVLAGLLDRFEIWSPARYAETKAKDSATWKQSLETLGLGE
jgi:MraZ protein